jgi:hypothetical protein
VDPTNKEQFDWLIRALYTLKSEVNAMETRAVN